MSFDPALPANNSLVNSAELRNQVNALRDLVNDCPTTNQMQDHVGEVAASTATGVNGLPGFVVSDPPTQGEVQMIVDKPNEFIAALNA